MQTLGASEREAFVVAAAEKREAVQARIQELGKERQSYIEAQRADSADADVGLDDAMKQGLRRIAESRGYEFTE